MDFAFKMMDYALKLTHLTVFRGGETTPECTSRIGPLGRSDGTGKSAVCAMVRLSIDFRLFFDCFSTVFYRLSTVFRLFFD